ncbi:MAG: YceI family protein [Spirosomaceae bacterium]|jgi:polyisoprenoid-binding protein YceI|nr:YceI family protein [Spirosomataceae bacterium]
MKTYKHTPYTIFFVLFLLVKITFAQNQNRKITADKANSTITYEMRHPMHTWEGICKNVSAVIIYNDQKQAIEQVAAVARVDCFDSGNSNRDSHALEVTEALKYPKISFTSTNIQQDQYGINIEGNLNFHGITKPVSFKALKFSGGFFVVDGNFTVKLSDFNVERPSLFGIKTEDLMKISFKIAFKI